MRTLMVLVLLALPFSAHADGGFVGLTTGYGTSTLEVSGFTDPSVAGGKIDHTHAGLAPAIVIGHRARWFRVAGMLEVPAVDLKTKKGGSSVQTGLSSVWLTLDGVLPIGRDGGIFAGIGFGAVNYETTVKEPGSTTVLDHGDLSNTLHAGYLHDVGRTTLEIGARFILSDEDQESGRYRVKSSTGAGAYLGIKYSF